MWVQVSIFGNSFKIHTYSYFSGVSHSYFQQCLCVHTHKKGPKHEQSWLVWHHNSGYKHVQLKKIITDTFFWFQGRLELWDPFTYTILCNPSLALPLPNPNPALPSPNPNFRCTNLQLPSLLSSPSSNQVSHLLIHLCYCANLKY